MAEVEAKIGWPTFIGGILMIIGTSIGGGMLALPVVTAEGGFFYSALYLFFSWLLMTTGALLLLEVNLYLPAGGNLVSMAEKTLGVPGKIIAWVSTLILLYSLLSAYVGGGGEIVQHFFAKFNVNISQVLSCCLFVFLFAIFLLRGIGAVDLLNRFIMAFKICSFFFILVYTLSSVKLSNFEPGNPGILTATITTMVTSFGFANIVPSLRTYYKSDVKKLRLAILYGSIVPLVFYLLWEFAIFGLIPLKGENGLMTLFHSSQPVVQLVKSLEAASNKTGILTAAHLFTSVCLFTAFLGVSLSFIDFLADGLKVKRGEKKFYWVFVFTFLPPVLCAIYVPSVFKFCLSFAGFFCMILLTILPACMAWSGRYKQNIQAPYRVFGGKGLIFLVIICSFIVMSIGLSHHFQD